MILIDTNIISEMMKVSPNENVSKWFHQSEILNLYISSITIAEISYGIHVLSEGNRRNALENAFKNTVLEAFSKRILSFDEVAAHYFGRIMGQQKIIGDPLGIPDGQIAAIATAQNLIIATRNTKDFENCGLELVNPFQFDENSKS